MPQSPFDAAFEQDLIAADHVMGEQVTVNGHGVRGVVPLKEFTTQLSTSIGGKTELPTLEVYLSKEVADGCGAAKGVIVVTQEGVTAKVRKVHYLGGAGVMLECGPLQTRDHSS